MPQHKSPLHSSGHLGRVVAMLHSVDLHLTLFCNSYTMHNAKLDNGVIMSRVFSRIFAFPLQMNCSDRRHQACAGFVLL